MPEFKVRKDTFLAYERVRKSGATNMYDIAAVIRLSGGKLSREDIYYIMEHYEKLCKEYL